MSIFNRITEPKTTLQFAVMFCVGLFISYTTIPAAKFAYQIGVTPSMLFYAGVACLLAMLSVFVIQVIRELFFALKNPGIVIGLIFSAGLGYLAYHII